MKFQYWLDRTSYKRLSIVMTRWKNPHIRVNVLLLATLPNVHL